jgi:hypothetical protein
MDVSSLLGNCTRNLLLVAVANAAIATGVTAEPVATTGQWTLTAKLPGGDACVARLVGSEVDTMLMLSESKELLLVAGNPEWQATSNSLKVELGIDNLLINDLTGIPFNNLVFVVVKEDAVLKRLKVARNLYWSFPFGKFHATVDGIGPAITWLHKCKQSQDEHSVEP